MCLVEGESEGAVAVAADMTYHLACCSLDDALAQITI